MSSRVIILHGTGGAPDKSWYSWVAERVRAQGYETLLPIFPPPETQSLASWMAAFDDQVGALRPDDILIGHSAGASLMVRLLERATEPVHASFFVAGFVNDLHQPDFAKPLATFYGPVDWTPVKKNAGKVFAYHGDDDPWVPVVESELIVSELGGTLRIVPGGKHLGESHNVRELPTLWADLSHLLDRDA